MNNTFDLYNAAHKWYDQKVYSLKSNTQSAQELQFLLGQLERLSLTLDVYIRGFFSQYSFVLT